MTASSDDPRARAEARIGATLDEKWRLERLIGLGGMAAVYAGLHRNGARGAVKILHPEYGRVREVRERFLREGYAANKVDHPGAVKVLDDDVVRSGPDAGAAYLIMELLEGESIEERIHARGLPFPIDEVLAIADDVLDVLAAAHAQGVIHRDLKPENLFLHVGDRPGRFGWQRVKVVDFGLARVAHGEAVTRAGMAIGTPSYMAPEQAEGRSEDIDGRSDLFGVGAIMFRLITGRRVHEASNVVELVTKMANTPASPIRSVRADVPESVAAIVDRALRFQRDERYPDAATMRLDVRAAREGRPLPSSQNAILIGSDPTLAAEIEAELELEPETESPAPPRPPPRPSGRPLPPERAPKKAPPRPRRTGVVVSVVWVVLVAGVAVATLGVFRRGNVGSELPGTAISASAVPESSAPAVTGDASVAAHVPDATDDGLGDVHADAAAPSLASAPKPAPKPTTTKPKSAPTSTKKPTTTKKKK
ncbi:MAG: serine/threonine protein kinase [Deltaproteobacteria bacterium]|nr:serine/threonine protein kinase [Deltaproteobacteria bacterium]